MELTIIAILVAYVIFLHLELNKNSKRAKRMADEIKQLKQTNRGMHAYHSYNDRSAPPEKLLEEKTHRFLLEDEEKQIVFIHYTRSIEAANSIIEQGFRFVDSFHKTAEQVTNDKIDLVYKHILHKNFGNYLIVICIDKNLFFNYQTKIKDIKKGVTPEQVLTEIPTTLDDDNDEVFLLSKRFVKGYVDLEKSQIVVNPDFNSTYDSPAFEQNVERLHNEGTN